VPGCPYWCQPSPANAIFFLCPLTDFWQLLRRGYGHLYVGSSTLASISDWSGWESQLHAEAEFDGKFNFGSAVVSPHLCCLRSWRCRSVTFLTIFLWLPVMYLIICCDPDLWPFDIKMVSEGGRRVCQIWTVCFISFLIYKPQWHAGGQWYVDFWPWPLTFYLECWMPKTLDSVNASTKFKDCAIRDCFQKLFFFYNFYLCTCEQSQNYWSLNEHWSDIIPLVGSVSTVVFLALVLCWRCSECGFMCSSLVGSLKWKATLSLTTQILFSRCWC